MSEYRIIEGDCVKAMKRMDEASIDAIVTDPPYELGFMGKAWDRTGIAYQQTTWAEALGILKPGGHLLAFGGTRTYHRLACAIEDAGFEIRDSLIWLYGSGFPKSLDVGKAIDKAAGNERGSDYQPNHGNAVFGEGMGGGITTQTDPPVTPEAAQWEGWGTALKPSHEPVVVARKPLTGTVAANVQEHGTGALNIDGCRVGTEERINQPMGGPENSYGGFAATATATATAGRWAANVALSPEAAAELDANDNGGASRFYYTAKASRGEREAGLRGAGLRGAGSYNLRTDAHSQRTGQTTAPRSNHHPTVKPINLMRWLVRLVTPPGGTILDPFLGSGTTGCAAALEGFDFIGIEREAEYVRIAEARIAFWSQHEGRDTAEVLGEANASERIKREHDERGQLALKNPEGEG